MPLAETRKNCRVQTREVPFMDFNKLKEMGLEYAEKGKNAAMDLAESCLLYTSPSPRDA